MLKKSLISLLIVLTIIFGMIKVASVAMKNQTSLSTGAFETANGFTAASASTGVSVTSASTLVLATTSSRTYARISNLSAAAIYCNMDLSKPAVAYSGIMIAASSSYVVSDAESNLYKQAINCISPSGTASTTIFQR